MGTDLSTNPSDLSSGFCDLSEEISNMEEPAHPQYIKKQATALQISIAAMEIFTKSLHSDGQDKCSLATFNHGYQMRLKYNSRTDNIVATLMQIMREGPSGSTKLRDTMVDFSAYLHNNKRRGNPCVCIVVTDGEDNASNRNVHTTIREVRKFSIVPENFFFLLGVGKGVKHEELGELMKEAGGYYIPVAGFGILMKTFAVLTIRVRRLIQVQGVNVRTQNHNMNIVRVKQGPNVLTRGSLDWGIALDISGSMGEKIDLE